LGFFSNFNKMLNDQAQIASAHFYIRHVIVPSIERLASEEHVDSVHEVKNMIRRNERLRDHSDDPRFRKKLSDVVAFPGVHIVLTRFRGRLESSDEYIISSVPWWMDRLKEANPSLYYVIDSESEGRHWFSEVLVDLVALLREYF
jgi:hypothetical protein